MIEYVLLFYQKEIQSFLHRYSESFVSILLPPSGRTITIILHHHIQPNATMIRAAISHCEIELLARCRWSPVDGDHNSFLKSIITNSSLWMIF